jgi:hypothetical protein
MFANASHVLKTPDPDGCRPAPTSLVMESQRHRNIRGCAG